MNWKSSVVAVQLCISGQTSSWPRTTLMPFRLCMGPQRYCVIMLCLCLQHNSVMMICADIQAGYFYFCLLMCSAEICRFPTFPMLMTTDVRNLYSVFSVYCYHSWARVRRTAFENQNVAAKDRSFLTSHPSGLTLWWLEGLNTARW